MPTQQQTAKTPAPLLLVVVLEWHRLRKGVRIQSASPLGCTSEMGPRTITSKPICFLKSVCVF